MSKKHPVVVVTGSSGAGTSTVKKALESIFHRQKINSVTIEGDSFHRYDRPAEVFASIDSSGAVEAYVRLKPMLEAAHREISPWNTSFDERLDEAIAHLLQVEVPDGELLTSFQELLQERFGIDHITMQIEPPGFEGKARIC